MFPREGLAMSQQKIITCDARHTSLREHLIILLWKPVEETTTWREVSQHDLKQTVSAISFRRAIPTKIGNSNMRLPQGRFRHRQPCRPALICALRGGTSETRRIPVPASVGGRPTASRATCLSKQDGLRKTPSS